MNDYKVDKSCKVFFDDNITTLFAYQELKHCFSQYGIHTYESKPIDADIYLSTSSVLFDECGVDKNVLRYDGYVIKAFKNKLYILGNEKRAVLFGVYDFLQSNGIILHKLSGVFEIKRLIERFSFLGEKICNPDFEKRGVTMVPDFSTEEGVEEVLETIDWCAKNRINDFFLHIGLLSDCTCYGKLFDELKKRDMFFEYGGHGCQSFIDQKLFETKPEMFCERNGKRELHGNFCVSNQDGVDMVINGVVDLVNKLPGLSFLHMWFMDGIEDSWCGCEECTKLSATEQQYYVVEKVSQRLQELNLDIKVDFLLYHDTIEVDDSIFVRDNNIIATYAPRERCYAHSIGDETCPSNQRYYQLLKKAVSKFGANNVMIFEYYFDMILFVKMARMDAHVIAQDLRDYKSLGISSVTGLGFGQYTFWECDINYYVYARHIFDTSLNIEDTVAEYLELVPAPKEKYAQYLNLMERYSQEIFALCGYLKTYADIRVIRFNEYFPKHIEKIKKSKQYLLEAISLMQEMYAENQNKFLAHQLELLEITRLETEAILQRMSIRWENHCEGTTPERIEKLYAVKDIYAELKEYMSQLSQAIFGSVGRGLAIGHLTEEQITEIDYCFEREFKKA